MYENVTWINSFIAIGHSEAMNGNILFLSITCWELCAKQGGWRNVEINH